MSRQYHRAALVLIPRVWRVQAALEQLSRDQLAQSGATDEARLALQELLAKSSSASAIYSWSTISLTSTRLPRSVCSVSFLSSTLLASRSAGSSATFSRPRRSTTQALQRRSSLAVR